MTQGSYRQFCPVAMAAEVLCRRWTIVLLRELVAGSTRFNDLRRGVPRMSPALLSQRLKELETAGILYRKRSPADPDVFEYCLTDAGRELRPIVEAFGMWGQRFVDAELSLQHLDVSLLMWDMRRNLDPTPLPPRRSVIQFHYQDLLPAQRSWWLLVEPGVGVDLCSVDPGFDVDLYVSTDLRTMTAIWMGFEMTRDGLNSGRLLLTGDRQLANRMQTWLGLSPFAKKPERLSEPAYNWNFSDLLRCGFGVRCGRVRHRRPCHRPPARRESVPCCALVPGRGCRASRPTPAACCPGPIPPLAGTVGRM